MSPLIIIAVLLQALCSSEIRLVESRSISLVIATPRQTGQTRLYLAKGLDTSKARQLSSIEHSLSERLKSLQKENKIDSKNHQAISSSQIDSHRHENDDGDDSSESVSFGRNLYLYPVAGPQPGSIYYKPTTAFTIQSQPHALYAQPTQQQQHLPQPQAYAPIYAYSAKPQAFSSVQPATGGSGGGYSGGASAGSAGSGQFGSDYSYLTQPQQQQKTGGLDQSNSGSGNSLNQDEDPYGWRAIPLYPNERPSTRPNFKKTPEVRPYEEDGEIEEQALVLNERFQPVTPPLKTTVIDIDVDKDILAHGKSPEDRASLKKEIEEKLNKGIITSIKKKLLHSPSAQEIGKLIMAAIEGEQTRVPDTRVDESHKFGHPGAVDWSKDVLKNIKPGEPDPRVTPLLREVEGGKSGGFEVGSGKKNELLIGGKPVFELDLGNGSDEGGRKSEESRLSSFGKAGEESRKSELGSSSKSSSKLSQASDASKSAREEQGEEDESESAADEGGRSGNDEEEEADEASSTQSESSPEASRTSLPQSASDESTQSRSSKAKGVDEDVDDVEDDLREEQSERKRRMKALKHAKA